MTFASCSSDNDTPETPKSAKETILRIEARHPSTTRATASDFEEGDRIGLFVAEAHRSNWRETLSTTKR